MNGDLLDLGGGGDVVLQESGRQRSRSSTGDGIEIVADGILDGAVEIRFLRITSGDGDRVRISQRFETMLPLGADWGLAGVVEDGGRRRTIWLPRPPRQVGPRDEVGRMEIQAIGQDGWSSGGGEPFSIILEPLPAGRSWSLPVVILDDPDSDHHEELERLSRSSWPRLMKSDWFDAASPADLWDSLIDGSIFDPRQSTCHKGRFRCQQCARAWWSYLRIAHRESGSPLMETLAREVAWTVKIQLFEPGGWVHGFWSEAPETHVRFFVEGIDLMLDEFEASDDSAWARAAENATRHLLSHFTEHLDEGGLWVLHDSLEKNGQPPAPRCTPGFGQSPGCSLVLNTHVQALTALRRLTKLRDVPESKEIRAAYDSGLEALRKMLELDGAPTVYRAIGALVKPFVEAKGIEGFRARITRILAFRLFPRLYWWVRRRYPRFVYPNGFIERDMGSSILADDYLVLNLKDLLVLYAIDPRDWMLPVLTGGLGFLANLDLRGAIERSSFFVEVTDVYQLASQVLGKDAGPAVDRLASQLESLSFPPSLDAAYRSSGSEGGSF